MSHSAPVRVFVVAPLLLRLGLEKLAHAAGVGIRIAGSADTIEEAIASLGAVTADVAVIDYDVGTDAPGLEQIAKWMPVLLLTSARGFTGKRDCFMPHVTSILCTGDSPAALLRSIEHAGREQRRGLAARAPALRDGWSVERDPDETRISRLTARERNLVLAMVCSDTQAAKVIAGRLSISEQTLRNHLSSIYGKLGVRNRLGLHAFAARHGLDRVFST